MLLHVCTFFTFFFTQVFAPFHICASLFSCFLLFVLSFFHSTFPLSHLYAHFCHHPQHFFFCTLQLMRLSACLFQFSLVSILAQSQASYNSYISLLPQSSCVVIVLILSTLGWCPLNVIIGKISVFLSTDSQSTGSLTLKSHVPVFALLSPFIAVTVIKWNSSLQVSAT